MATTTAPSRRATDNEQPVEEPKSKKKLLVAGGAAVVALLAAWYLLLGPGAGHEPVEPKAPVPGEVLALEPITMNLADGRLLKVGLALQLAEGAGGGHGPVNGSIALDEAIAFLGTHRYDQLAVPAGREAAKTELSKRVAKRYHDEVMEVYFTEFVMQ